ncbi:MAG TPA: cytochrome b/b6 domain-containing protein [Phycisphaerales bacterium]|nr:cytochrome b/b6 domain-containing protein [Phycisphaerales bacterium]
MNRVLIWDLPIRLFHWMLAGGFIAAAVISLWLGDDSPLFPYHAIIGLTIAFMVCLRVVWGVIGTRYAKFGTFIFGPGALIEHMKGTLVGGGRRYVGHNPGSALAIFALLALVPALAVTGIMLGRGDTSVKDLHEILAWVTVGVVVAHVLGVALHIVRHRENITASMIHGKKHARPSDAIASARPIIAVVFLVIVGAWAAGLVRNYSPATRTTTLPLIGTMLQLGDNESAGEGGGVRNKKHHDGD